MLTTFHRRVASATMIIENESGDVLIVKANYKLHWTFPGGVIDEGETPKQAACRETFEEVGILVDPEVVQFVAVVDRKSALVQTYQFIFRAPSASCLAENIILQASEIDSFAFVSKAEVFSANRDYGKVIEHWAYGTTGYIEQTFGE